MEIHKRADRRTQNNKAGPKWTVEEDKAMYEIARTIKIKAGRMSWNKVIVTMQKSFPKFHKSAEQCIRRYKCYLNPSSYTSAWRAGQGVLLMLLHQVYGNEWKIMAPILREKSVSILSEYFYEYIHKIIKIASQAHIPLAFTDKPIYLIEASYIMDLLQSKYIPEFAKPGANILKDSKEVTVLSWLRQYEITTTQISAYRELVFKKVKEHYKVEELPFSIVIDLDKAQIYDKEAEELIKRESLLNSSSLKELVLIKLESSIIHRSQIQEKLNNQPEPVIQPIPQAEAIVAVNKEEPETNQQKASGSTEQNDSRNFPLFSFPIYRSMLPIFLTKKPVNEMPYVYPPQMYPSPIMPSLTRSPYMGLQTMQVAKPLVNDAINEPVSKKKKEDSPELN